MRISTTACCSDFSHLNLEAACKEALGQIEKREYGDAFYDEEIEKVLKYGIACYKNKCKVMLAASRDKKAMAGSWNKSENI